MPRRPAASGCRAALAVASRGRELQKQRESAEALHQAVCAAQSTPTHIVESKGRRVRFFCSASALREWLREHGEQERELWVGFYRKSHPRHAFPVCDAVDQALAFGWIDGVLHKIDDTRYAVRITPRRKNSNWSAVNVARYHGLLAAGEVEEPGRAAFEARDRSVSEDTRAALSPALERVFRRNSAAWSFFCAQPPGYRRRAAWHVMSAKREETRLSRLRALVASSAQGRRHER